jgi:hypothetical protein
MKSTFFFDTASGELLGKWTLPRAQTELENCTIHNYNITPTARRDVLVTTPRRVLRAEPRCPGRRRIAGRRLPSWGGGLGNRSLAREGRRLPLLGPVRLPCGSLPTCLHRARRLDRAALDRGAGSPTLKGSSCAERSPASLEDVWQRWGSHAPPRAPVLKTWATVSQTVSPNRQIQPEPTEGTSPN